MYVDFVYHKSFSQQLNSESIMNTCKYDFFKWYDWFFCGLEFRHAAFIQNLIVQVVSC